MAVPVATLVGSVKETASDGSINIPNTTPPASGNYLVAFVAGYISGGSRTLNTPAGWSLQASQSGDTHCVGVYTKTADAGDVSAGSFTFSFSGALDVMIGAIVKVTNPAVGNEIAGSEVDTGTTSFTFTTAVTPTTPDSVALALYSDSNNTGIGTLSAYASTPSATWSEVVQDNGVNGSPAMSFGLAKATLSSTSEITSRTATSSEALSRTRGLFIIINGYQDASYSASVQSVVSSIQEPTATGTASVSVGVQSITSSVVAPAVTTPADKWSNATKSTTTWSNTSKN
jgi:hypothetical protein